MNSGFKKESWKPRWSTSKWVQISVSTSDGRSSSSERVGSRFFRFVRAARRTGERRTPWRYRPECACYRRLRRGRKVRPFPCCRPAEAARWWWSVAGDRVSGGRCAYSFGILWIGMAELPGVDSGRFAGKQAVSSPSGPAQRSSQEDTAVVPSDSISYSLLIV